MKKHIVRTLIVLWITISHSSTFDDYYDSDYSEEDLEYDTYFDNYDPGKYISWGEDTSGKRGDLVNLKGTVRQLFLLNTLKNHPEASVVCSPISVILSLGKLALGAEGQCLTDLLRAIGLKNKKQLKKAFKPVINGLANLEGVRLHILSKIYVSKEVRLRSKFRKRARKIFKSSVRMLDFNKPSASSRTINEWVKKQTRGGIEKIVSEHDISPETSLVLVNAVYFAGFWEKQFEKVSEANFYTMYTTQKIPMMTRSGNYKYGRSDPLDSQLVEIPYQGKKASFLVVLPNSKGGLSILLDKIHLAPGLLVEATRRMYPTDIILSIPKFRKEIQVDLRVAFQMLHLSKLFDTRNSGLESIVKGKRNIHLSKAVHRAIIVVNELGTKAAASTAMDIEVVSNLKKIIFNANHPFLYFVLFEGEQIFAGTMTLD